MTRSRRATLAVAPVAVVLSLTLALTACSSSKSGSSTTPAGASTSTGAGTSAGGIVIKNFGYSGTLTVKAGQTVTVTNQDSAPHTVTDKVNKAFDSGEISGSGGTGTFVAPSTPGTYKFGCTFHASMAGTLTVTS